MKFLINQGRAGQARRVVVLALVVASLLPGVGTGGTAFAMTGGQTQSPEPGWAARLDVRGQPNCTGSLIAPSWIITAGHCVLGHSASQITVRIRGASLTPISIHRHPDYTAAKVRYPDLGLVRLPIDAVTELGASLLAIGNAEDLAYFTNQGVSVFGYGRDESGAMTSEIKKSPDGAWKLARYCQVRNDKCFVRANWAKDVTAIRGGDSGGPWVGWRAGHWRLLAVVSGYPSVDVQPLQAGTSPIDSAMWQWMGSVIGGSFQGATSYLFDDGCDFVHQWYEISFSRFVSGTGTFGTGSLRINGCVHTTSSHGGFDFTGTYSVNASGHGESGGVVGTVGTGDGTTSTFAFRLSGGTTVSGVWDFEGEIPADNDPVRGFISRSP